MQAGCRGLANPAWRFQTKSISKPGTSEPGEHVFNTLFSISGLAASYSGKTSEATSLFSRDDVRHDCAAAHAFSGACLSSLSLQS